MKADAEGRRAKEERKAKAGRRNDVVDVRRLPDDRCHGCD